MTKTGRAKDIFKPEFRFGMGGVSLGNEFNKITDKAAQAALETAWNVDLVDQDRGRGMCRNGRAKLGADLIDDNGVFRIGCLRSGKMISSAGSAA